ncbi:RpiR family transcriptional regulator [Anaerobacillus alkalilacustris]|uniref:RpiR family transcriptional regulator n=1 Tax=Anaerobacillus alkalilacustris TaxID=393763 RepID=A0A1S2LZ34_9BACI|nr:MurR/RpiR family transcriptional regulator [Anaerobacillus alkalilacustris]OIJ17510.1 RpiR family transcriptional regulator [Anaerobacillus alkalilacustris]
MIQTHCIARIKSSYSDFSDKEKKIADYIMDSPKNIIHSTINQVAEDLGVAEATVFRFCKRIGFKGYQAMKIALASEVVTPMNNIHEKIQVGDDEKAVAEKVFKSNIRTLEETLRVIEQESFKKAVDAILNADKVAFYGNGGSGAVADDAHHKFIRTGIQTATYSDSHLQVMSASLLSKNDVAILISHSGSNLDMLQVLNVAKEAGATTVAITTLAKSPLSQGADITLYTVSDETEYRSEALSSRLAQLSIIDALYVNVSIARKELMQESLNKIRNAISLKRF